ncbi:unnamed protein product [Nyctereutes procyonoides]|uniref:(raccoon dog) hypothetical protein n=1 Tax=Nyctereutes procyonoides TaxID=34880 RepID=A0A811YZ87_NYCPR|nr:unnamed protein product [Nyctereutes procyonoides]
MDQATTSAQERKRKMTPCQSRPMPRQFSEISITCSRKHARETRPTIIVYYMLTKEQNQNQEILENSTHPGNSLCVRRPGDLELLVTSPEETMTKSPPSHLPHSGVCCTPPGAVSN